MNLSRIEWVFFDLGDTLVDNTMVWQGMLKDLRKALGEMGRDHSLEELFTLFESASRDNVANPFSDVQITLGLDEAERQFAEDSACWRYELEEIVHGVPDLLAALKERYKLGVIANQSPGSETRYRQIRPFFDVFMASSECGERKPNPRFFQLALETAQCLPERAVMVGDRMDNDIRPARLLGMKTIRILKGYQRFQQPRDEWDVADFTVYSLEEAERILLSREALV